MNAEAGINGFGRTGRAVVHGGASLTVDPRLARTPPHLLAITRSLGHSCGITATGAVA